MATAPGHACAQGTGVLPCGWCCVDSSAHSARSHHHIHKMVPVRDRPRQRSTLRQLEVDVNPRLAQSPVSLSPRQNSQFGDPSTLSPLHLGCKADIRHKEVYFKKIIYKRPFVSVFSAGFQRQLGAQGPKLLPPRCWDKQQRGSGGRPGRRGFRGPRPLLV